MVLNTGNLDHITDSKLDNLTLIKSENEAMVRGERQQAIWSERHSMHMREHMEVLNDPELKKDVALVQRVLDHVMEHANLLRNTDPALLQMIGETPLPPLPKDQAQPIPTNNIPKPDQQGPVPMDQGNASMMAPPSDQGQNMPNMPRPAGEGTTLPPNMPTKPEDLI